MALVHRDSSEPPQDGCRSGYCPPEMARVLLDAQNDTGKFDNAKLPSKLSTYKADVAYDLWSFGCVLSAPSPPECGVIEF